MGQIAHRATVRDGPERYTTGITDLVVVESGRGQYLYSINGAVGGLVVRSVANGLRSVDTGFLPPVQGLPAPLGFVPVIESGAPGLLVLGAPDRLLSFRIQRDGELGAQAELQLAGGGASLDLQVATLAGRDHFYTVSRHDGGVVGWTREAGGDLRLVARAQVGPATEGNDLLALAQVAVAGRPHLIAASVGDGSLSTLALDPAGQITVIAQTGLRDGLGIAAPKHLATVTAHGQDYVVVGAPGSSSITILRLDGDGRLVATDQVNDDLSTRFHAVPVLEAASLPDGRAYVVAGGADDGLTVLQVLPGGRLLHRATIEDDAAMALEDPAALALGVRAEGLDIFVTGAEGPHLTHLTYTPGAAGIVASAPPGGGTVTGTGRDDILRGGPGPDRIEGGAGADVLIDGAGSDTLVGGPGPDVFVLQKDGVPDTILDFEPGVDRMDLSQLGRFYTVEALDIVPTQQGATIRIGDERVDVVTAERRPLDPASLEIGDLRDLWHVPVAVAPERALDLGGSAGDDTIIGGPGPDELFGGAGRDELRGLAGADVLHGELPDADFDETAAQVYRLYRATLGREPDEQGHWNWTQRIAEQGLSLEAAAFRFVASPEFRTRYDAARDEDFVTLLYRNVLEREPDADGFAAWVGALQTGSRDRESAVLGFSESREFRAETASEALGWSRAAYQARWSDDVFRLYQATLDRPPDLQGFLNWTARLADGRPYLEVVGGFVDSREFQTRFDARRNEDFVTLLYNNVLDRDPDPTGLETWTRALSGEARDRTEVVAGFAQSREFRRETSEALSEWMRAQGRDDRLAGGTGNDTLLGGVLADEFVFAPGEGRNTVVDLEPWDWIDVRAFDYDSVAALRQSLSQRGEDVIFVDAGTEVRFLDTVVGDLSDNQFLI